MYGQANSCLVTLTLKEGISIYQPARRLSPSQKKEVDKQIKDWLNEGIIKESCSEYVSTNVLRKKKHEDARIYVDLRKLNKVIKKDRFPLSFIEDHVDKLQKAKIFNICDLKHGFSHVQVHKVNQKYLSFIVPNGQYEFRKTSFGLCNSLSIFHKYINRVFKDLIKNEGVLRI